MLVPIASTAPASTPKVIESEAEHDAALAIIETLMEKSEDALSEEEHTLLALLPELIAAWESNAYAPMPDGSPVDALKTLMEFLGGRRGISRTQAKRLTHRFKVPPAVFL